MYPHESFKEKKCPTINFCFEGKLSPIAVKAETKIYEVIRNVDKNKILSQIW